jgi:peptidyl-prolyl cis-trans isomerase D
MATLETLRTKAGVFLSVIIGIALLAFIVNADTIATARNIFSSGNDVGNIAGNKIGIEEFQNLLDYNTEIHKITYAMYQQDAPMNDEVNENLRNKTWQDLIMKYVLETEYENIGLEVSDIELADLTVTGTNLSPRISQIFTNYETGVLDRAQLSAFVQNMSGIAKVWWIDLERQIRNEQLYSKYSQLDSKSNYVNSLDVEHALVGEKNNVEFSYILKDYNTVPDSLISYKESDLKKYYERHKSDYKTTRSRDVEFVAFTVTPSANDYERVMYKMEEIQAKMDTVSPANMPLFVRINSDEPFDDAFYKKGELPAVLDSVIFDKTAGTVFPYYQEGESYNLTGIVEFKNLPDSVKADHILFSQANLGKVDSVFNLLKSGASFAALAEEFGTDGTSTKGGDLGWFAFKSMVRPFSDSCFFKPVGSLMKVTTQYGVHIVKIREAKIYNNKVQLATVKKVIRPSKETYQNYFAQANRIAAQSQGDLAKFRAACAEDGFQPRTEINIALDSKAVGTYQRASNLIRWMYEANEGDVSGVLEIDDRNTYIVAALTGIKDAGISPLGKVKPRVAAGVVTEKKAGYLVSQISEAKKDANTIDEVAVKLGLSVTSVTPAVNFNSSFIPTLRMPESGLLGAVTNTPENKLSEPVIGESGVYLYVVTSIAENTQAQTPEAIKSRLEANNYSTLYMTLLDKAKVVDNRGKFY